MKTNFTLILMLLISTQLAFSQFITNHPISRVEGYKSHRIDWDPVDIQVGICDLVNNNLILQHQLNGRPRYTFNDAYYTVEMVAKGDGEVIKTKTFTPNSQGMLGVLNNQGALFSFLVSARGYQTINVKMEVKRYEFNNDPGYSAYYLRSKYTASRGLLVCGDTDGGGGDEGKPDLTFDAFQTTVTSECTNCFINLGDSQSGPLHTVTFNGGATTLRIVPRVKNVGDGSSPATKVTYFLSSNNSLSSSDYELSATNSVPAINAGSEAGTNGISITSSTLLGAGVPFNKIYYVLLVVDNEKKIEEQKEDNNVVSLPFIFKKNSQGGGGGGGPILEELLFEATPHTLAIYQISNGKKLVDLDVASAIDEAEQIKRLPQGFYLIKSGDKVYKLLK